MRVLVIQNEIRWRDGWKRCVPPVTHIPNILRQGELLMTTGLPDVSASVLM